MNLNAGQQIMRFSIISLPLFNIDKIVFELPDAVEILNDEDPLFSVFQNQDREIVFKSENKSSIRQVQIYNITGSLLYTFSEPKAEFKISTSEMQTGIYIIQVITDEQKICKKIAIN
jgi:hypothetical protein